MLYDFQRNCELWDVTAADTIEGDPVITSIPTLFMQGALDPVTPIDYLSDQLKHFQHHAVLVFEDSSHWGSVAWRMRHGASWVFC